jgi:hypothetical protein
MITIKSMGVFLCVVAFVGCASSFKIVKLEHDPFRPDLRGYGTSTIWKENGLVAAGGNRVGISFQCAREKGFALVANTSYLGSDWVFITELTFLVDGKIFPLKATGTPYQKTMTVLDRVFCNERNTFIIPDSLRLALSNARSVQIRLTGEHEYIDDTMSAQDVLHIREFMSVADTLETEGRE